MRIQHQIDIAASPSRVWELTVDVEALPDHTPTMTKVDRLEQAPLAIGSKVRIKQPAQRAKIWTITELDDNRRFSWTTRSTGTAMTASHDLAETSTGTTNTLTVEMNGPLGAVFGVLVRRQIQKALATENRAFKTAAETPQET
jgi:carbon monoxide dehydrogenase subunit G